MIPEVLDNPHVGNILRGASIILAVEPRVQLLEALQRSKIAENKTDADLEETINLMTKVRRELDLNGEEDLSRENARKVLKHMLEDPPWNRMSEKHDLP